MLVRKISLGYAGRECRVLHICPTPVGLFLESRIAPGFMSKTIELRKIGSTKKS